jgi:RIO-like serine/threonine protein kinase
MYKIRASIRIESALGKGVCKFHRIGSTSGKKRKAEKSKKAAKKKKKRRDDSDLSEQVMRNLCFVLENIITKRLSFFPRGSVKAFHVFLLQMCKGTKNLHQPCH